MAKVFPLRGLRYAPAYAAKMDRLVTPPYDIISCQAQNRFYRQHAYNIIRLEFGKIRSTDTPCNNRYTRAYKTLQQWLQASILYQEAQPAFYLLQTQYTLPVNVRKTFTGLFACVQLEPLGQGHILPHEQTYAGPKLDRFNLLQATGVSFSPVLSLYQDRVQKIRKLLTTYLQRQSLLNFVDWAGCRHRLWVISHAPDLAAIKKAFAGKKLLIADGHHRYATALAYQQQFRDKVGPTADRVMMCLADTDDPGLSVQPVYRLVRKIAASRWKEFYRQIHQWFKVIQIIHPQHLPATQAEMKRKTKSPVLGFIADQGRRAYLLIVKPTAKESRLPTSAAKHSSAYGRLDVVLLNQLILVHLLGIQANEEKGRLSYVKSLAEACQALTQGEAQAAFLPSLPDLKVIWDLARGGETMPHKSTYFLPKIITGLVMNPVAIPKCP